MISPYVYEQLAYIDDDEECCSSMFDVVDDVDDDRGDVDEPMFVWYSFRFIHSFISFHSFIH